METLCSVGAGGRECTFARDQRAVPVDYHDGNFLLDPLPPMSDSDNTDSAGDHPTVPDPPDRPDPPDVIDDLGEREEESAIETIASGAEPEPMQSPAASKAFQA